MPETRYQRIAREQTADIERVIGYGPGTQGFQVTAGNIANLRDWLVTKGISRDRANACRASTLERVYRYPHELRKLLWRGEYKGEESETKPETFTTNEAQRHPEKLRLGTVETRNRCAPRLPEFANPISDTPKDNETAQTVRNGGLTNAAMEDHATRRENPLVNGRKPDMGVEQRVAAVAIAGCQGGSGLAYPSLTDVQEGILTGAYSDQDVLTFIRACKAHLGV